MKQQIISGGTTVRLKAYYLAGNVILKLSVILLIEYCSVERPLLYSTELAENK